MPNQDTRAWIIDELTLMAVAYGAPMTAERLQIYAADLSDIPIDQLALAFRRARRESKFFPTISKLRELAGASEAESAQAEGLEAWAWLNTYLQRHGAEGRTYWTRANPACKSCRGDGFVYEGEGTGSRSYYCDCRESTPAPPVPARVAAAARLIGGLERLARVRESDRGARDYGFVRREFLEAYRLAPLTSRVDLLAAPAIEVRLLGDPGDVLVGDEGRGPND